MIKELPPMRRIVCEINKEGKSVFVEDGPPKHNRTAPDRPGFRVNNLWATFGMPAPLNATDRSSEVKGTMPPSGGTVFKYLDIPPDRHDPARTIDAGRIENTEPGLRRVPGHPLHPGMHETDTIDYATVVKRLGELVKAEKFGLDRYMPLTLGPAAFTKSPEKMPSDPMRTVFSRPDTSRDWATV